MTMIQRASNIQIVKKKKKKEKKKYDNTGNNNTSRKNEGGEVRESDCMCSKRRHDGIYAL
jgi:hypothetical protein